MSIIQLQAEPIWALFAAHFCLVPFTCSVEHQSLQLITSVDVCFSSVNSVPSNTSDPHPSMIIISFICGCTPGKHACCIFIYLYQRFCSLGCAIYSLFALLCSNAEQHAKYQSDIKYQISIRVFCPSTNSSESLRKSLV
jgi:hypothetical protein